MTDDLKGLLPPALEELLVQLPIERQPAAAALLALGYAHGSIDAVERTAPHLRTAHEALLAAKDRAKVCVAAVTPLLPEIVS